MKYNFQSFWELHELPPGPENKASREIFGNKIIYHFPYLLLLIFAGPKFRKNWKGKFRDLNLAIWQK